MINTHQWFYPPTCSYRQLAKFVCSSDLVQYLYNPSWDNRPSKEATTSSYGDGSISDTVYTVLITPPTDTEE